MQTANDTTDKPSPNEAVTKTGNSNLGMWSNGYPALNGSRYTLYNVA